MEERTNPGESDSFPAKNAFAILQVFELEDEVFEHAPRQVGIVLRLVFDVDEEACPRFHDTIPKAAACRRTKRFPCTTAGRAAALECGAMAPLYDRNLQIRSRS